MRKSVDKADSYLPAVSESSQGVAGLSPVNGICLPSPRLQRA